jgi:iron complex outermembrane receptor protein
LRNLAGQPVPNDVFSFSTPSTYTEYAGFGDLTWLITDKFDVTGGVRYAENRQEVVQIGSGLLGSSRPATRATDDVLTYLANARYRFNSHAATYLRYATGYRPGGPNYPIVDPATGVVTPTDPFEADKLKSYEAGVKLETADRLFGLEIATYYIDWNNIQVTTTRSGLGIIANLPGGAEIRGAELSLLARPIQGLTATVAFAYQDAKTSEAAPALGAAKDAQLPNVPRSTATLSTDYALPFGSLRPTLGATLRYVDKRVAGFGAAPYRLPNYTSVDLRAGLTFGSVDAQFFVHNAFDERGQMSAIVSGTRGGALPAILQPRTFGVFLSTGF